MGSTRRHFLQSTTAAGMAPPLLAQAARPAANDRIQIALIGAGGMGSGDVASALQIPGVEITRGVDRQLLAREPRMQRQRHCWRLQYSALNA